MTDASPPAAPTWGAFLMGLLPSLNQSIVLVVTFALGLGGGAAGWQKLAAPGKTEAPQLSAVFGTDEVIHRLSLIEGNTSLCVDSILAFREEWRWKAPKPPEKAKVGRAGLPAAKAAVR